MPNFFDNHVSEFYEVWKNEMIPGHDDIFYDLISKPRKLDFDKIIEGYRRKGVPDHIIQKCVRSMKG